MGNVEDKAMNTTVAAYVPKNKTYSTTHSLDTRVAIAGGVQILGYSSFWLCFINKFSIDVYTNLLKCIEERNNIKDDKIIREQSDKEWRENEKEW